MKNFLNFYRKSAIIACLSLTACSSIPISQVNDRIQAWKSSPIDKVIEYWGLPTQKQEINDKFYAEWLNKESSPGNTAISIGSGSRSGRSSFGFGLTLFDLGGTDDTCSRIVTYDVNGLVIDIIWKGTKDYCFEITPDRNQMIINKANMEETSPPTQ